MSTGRREKSRNWTPPEDAEITDMFVLQGMTALQIARKLGRTKNQVSGRLDRLGITRNLPKFDWTEERERFVLEQHRRGLRYPSIAKELGVGVVALRAKAHRMGLSHAIGDNTLRGRRVKGGIAKNKPAPPKLSVVPVTPPPMVDEGSGVPLAEREGCCDVMGYSRKRGPLYCNAPLSTRATGSYCDAHARLYFQPLKTRQR